MGYSFDEDIFVIDCWIDTKEKEETLSQMEESQEFIYQNTYLKLASLFSYWFFSGVVDKEEFDKILKEQNG